MRNIYLLLIIFFVGCNSDTENKIEKENIKKDSVEIETAIPNEEDNEDQLTLSLEEFTNIEQVGFCIFLPLKKYELLVTQSDERAKFVFTNKINPAFYIQVQGMFRGNPSVSIEDYFKNTYSEEETEANGKIIVEKELIKDKNCFWARGYWSNTPNQPFLEITWLRKDDVVVFYWSFNVKEEANYQAKVLNYLIKSGVDCTL